VEKIEEIKLLDVDKYKEERSPQRKRKALPRGRG
jgi:hypothetical protein